MKHLIFLFTLTLSIAGYAQDKRVADLAVKAPLTGPELLYVVDGTTPYQTTFSTMFNLSSGRVPYWNGTIFANGAYWDNTNTRLGIGESTPSQMLSIRSQAANDEAAISYNRNGSYSWRVGIDGNAGNLGGSSSDFIFRDQSIGAVRAAIKATTGIFSIGTASPSANYQTYIRTGSTSTPIAGIGFDRAGSYNWAIGVEGSGATLGGGASDFVIYDQSQTANRLSVKATTGYVHFGATPANSQTVYTLLSRDAGSSGQVKTFTMSSFAATTLDDTDAATFRTTIGALTGSLTSGRVPYASGSATLSDEADFTYNSGTNTLTVDQLTVDNTAFVGGLEITGVHSSLTGNVIESGSVEDFYIRTGNGSGPAFEPNSDLIIEAGDGDPAEAHNGASIAINPGSAGASGTSGNLTITIPTAGTDGKLIVNNLPTSNPGSNGLWNNSGVVSIGAATLASGTYSPTITGITNIGSSSSSTAWQYLRVGSVVNVSGSVEIDPTAVGLTVIDISLPVASSFSGSAKACGTGAETFNNQAGGVLSNATDDRARYAFNATSTSAYTHYVHFTYVIE
jgi:hypothetical protein